jgi:hypothetical protein
VPLRISAPSSRSSGAPLRSDDLPLRSGDLPLRTGGLPLRSGDLPLRSDRSPLERERFAPERKSTIPRNQRATRLSQPVISRREPFSPTRHQKIARKTTIVAKLPTPALSIRCYLIAAAGLWIVRIGRPVAASASGFTSRCGIGGKRIMKNGEKPKPVRGETTVIACSAPNGAGNLIWRCLPTAGAVGYRSFGAPRLALSLPPLRGHAQPCKITYLL